MVPVRRLIGGAKLQGLIANHMMIATMATTMATPMAQPVSNRRFAASRWRRDRIRHPFKVPLQRGRRRLLQPLQI
jgi:hypothetical protein